MNCQDSSVASNDFGPCVAFIRTVTVLIQRLSHAVRGGAERRRFILQVVQPGLAGLMEGSVSTLAPVFAAASIGAGISMGFAEALSDDGVLSGRGHPRMRGLVGGLMTTLGGIGHALPFLIASFTRAVVVAVLIVGAELALIAFILRRYMDTPLVAATFQAVAGDTLVFLAGIFIGSV